jgi:hypothetical protein
MFALLLAFSIHFSWGPRLRVNPAVAKVRTVFVSGNSNTANAVRRDLSKLEDRYGDQACFAQAVSSKADAVLSVDQREEPAPLFGSQRQVLVGSATLTRKGDVIWSDSKQGQTGMFQTGAGDAASNLEMSLYRAAGCDVMGKRKARVQE